MFESIEVCGIPMTYEPGTSDLRVIKEVIHSRCYRKTKIGFDVEAGETWLDLGANIGAFAIYAMSRKASFIECYEPDSRCFDLLWQNTMSLGMIALNQFAVTEYEANELSFYKGKSSDDKYRQTIIPNKNPIGKLPNLHASEVFNHRSWNGVKMDIEGSELGLIDKQLIPSCDKLVLEYHLTKDNDMKNFRYRMDILRSYFDYVDYIPSLDRGYPGDIYPGFFDRLVFCYNR